jgi:hypothetical protein
MGKPGDVDPAHPLAAAWSNAELMLQAMPAHKSTSCDLPEAARQTAMRENSAEWLCNLVVLDWFAERVDRYAKCHLVDGDSSLAAMLHAWLIQMPLNPLLMPGEQPPPVMPQG